MAIARTARQGLAWSAVAQIVQQALSMLATLALARLLTPADFGLVAVGVSVLAVAQLTSNLGFGPGLVRRNSVDEAVIATTLWLTFGASLVFTGVIAILASPLAELLGQPSATGYLRLTAVVLGVSLLGTVPAALLQRDLRLKAYNVVQMVATGIYVVVEIALALAGVGARAVVIGQLAMACCTFVGWSMSAGLRPRWAFDTSFAKEASAFASGWSGVQLFAFIGKNADYWIVSRVLGSSALGSYYLAFVLPSIFRQRLNWITQSVLFPLFSRSQDHGLDVPIFYRRVVRLQLSVAVPVLTGTALLADPLVLLLFGDQWSGVASPLRWLALSALLGVVGQTLVGAALALGAVQRNLGVQALSTAALVCGVLVGITLSPSTSGAAAGVAAASLVQLLVQQALLGPQLQLRHRELLADVSRLSLASVCMAAVVSPILTLDLGPLVTIALAAGAGAVAFALSAALLARPQVLPLCREVQRMYRGGRGSLVPRADR